MSLEKSFPGLLEKIHDFKAEKKLAVAVSGGADSMALAWLLARFAADHGIELHALTVDHGLRTESKAEAKQVSLHLSDWPCVRHKILTWTGVKPENGIQEAARQARYELMAEYCRSKKIDFLFLGHHADDQVETFLMRLAKGSGPDGLSAMQVLQRRKDLILVRPLIDIPHSDLIDLCRRHGIDWVEDPSNSSPRFARARLRGSKAILEKEGLTARHILTLTNRLDRMRQAFESLADREMKNCLISAENGKLSFDLDKFRALPKELALRLLQKALFQLGGEKPHPPKLNILEKIVDEIFDRASFRAATLAGCIIRRRKTRGVLEVTLE